jgi:membrane protein CcdC involved in cytochrome C biogenesis
MAILMNTVRKKTTIPPIMVAAGVLMLVFSKTRYT